MPPLADLWLQFRDRLLADRRFQKRAASSIFTRRIARRRARALFDICAGFVYSQVLAACVSLKLFDILKAGPQSAPALAERIGLTEDSMLRLLEAAVSLDLLSRRSGDRFGLGSHGAALLANPGISAMVAHHAMFYSDLADPVGLLRGTTPPTQLSRFWGYARSGGPERLTEAQIAGYTELMSASQDLVADDILDAYPVAEHRVLLDIGGGDGTFAAHAANRAPELKIMLFDLPAVADRARARFERVGIAERATAYGGDFATGLLPEGADLITLVRVLHDHDDEKVRRILSAARLAARPGATLLVAEPVSGTKSAEPMADAYFGFYLMAMGSGRPRTLARISELVCAAGFSSPRTVPTRMPLQTSLIAAKCR